MHSHPIYNNYYVPKTTAISPVGFNSGEASNFTADIELLGYLSMLGTLSVSYALSPTPQVAAKCFTDLMNKVKALMNDPNNKFDPAIKAIADKMISYANLDTYKAQWPAQRASVIKFLSRDDVMNFLTEISTSETDPNVINNNINIAGGLISTLIDLTLEGKDSDFPLSKVWTSAHAGDMVDMYNLYLFQNLSATGLDYIDEGAFLYCAKNEAELLHKGSPLDVILTQIKDGLVLHPTKWTPESMMCFTNAFYLNLDDFIGG